MHNCYLALGGNVGNVSTTFAKALHLLDERAIDEKPETNLLQVSSYHGTVPVGKNAGAETVFLNAVCQIETSLEPLPLLDKLQSIEKKMGRERTIHWGPRTIDLDIILYDES
ncbi:Dihydroneopterin aldolase / 2-amino-4-hydroxy-6-hydroxymethyldihydropteridine pyrophosphokinase, partial [hydrothermal vent metagenome]